MFVFVVVVVLVLVVLVIVLLVLVVVGVVVVVVLLLLLLLLLLLFLLLLLLLLFLLLLLLLLLLLFLLLFLLLNAAAAAASEANMPAGCCKSFSSIFFPYALPLASAVCTTTTGSSVSLGERLQLHLIRGSACKSSEVYCCCPSFSGTLDEQVPARNMGPMPSGGTTPAGMFGAYVTSNSQHQQASASAPVVQPCLTIMD